MFLHFTKGTTQPLLDISSWKKYRRSNTFRRNLKQKKSLTDGNRNKDKKFIVVSRPVSLLLSSTPGLMKNNIAMASPVVNVSDQTSVKNNIAMSSAVFNICDQSDYNVKGQLSYTEADGVDEDGVSDTESDGFNSCGSESDAEDEDKDLSSIGYREMLQQWATSYNISHAALNELLKLQNEKLGLQLPLDARTLLKTPQTINIIALEDDGFYWHHGIKRCLSECFSNLTQSISISLNINIDGLPLGRSTNKQFWPILANIFEYPGIAPFVIGLYYGKRKPSSVRSYLQPFVDEVQEIIQNGIVINDRYRIKISIRCFICDSPARAFAKCKMFYFNF